MPRRTENPSGCLRCGWSCGRKRCRSDRPPKIEEHPAGAQAQFVADGNGPTEVGPSRIRPNQIEPNQTRDLEKISDAESFQDFFVRAAAMASQAESGSIRRSLNSPAPRSHWAPSITTHSPLI